MDGSSHRFLAHALPRLVAAVVALAPLAGGAHSAIASEDSGTPPQQRWPVGGVALATAAELAAAHWGATPCRGRVALTWAPLAPGINARSNWRHAGSDAFGLPARNSDCSITLSDAADWDWEKLCTVVIHEVGHLDGHPHSPDVHDVMAETYLDPAPECAGTPEPDPADDSMLSSYLAATVPSLAPAPAATRAPATVTKVKSKTKAKRAPRAKSRGTRR
jgi:hypothetical protein